MTKKRTSLNGHPIIRASSSVTRSGHRSARVILVRRNSTCGRVEDSYVTAIHYDNDPEWAHGNYFHSWDGDPPALAYADFVRRADQLGASSCGQRDDPELPGRIP